MLEKMILAGFGGQGIMFLGKLLCVTFMKEGYHVTYIPSYGAEQRGGTANCHVILSTDPIGSPMVERATTVIAMNPPSYEKFKTRVTDDGLMVINNSMVDLSEDINTSYSILKIPATDIANEIGNVRLANMVILGGLNAVKELLDVEKFFDTFKEFLVGKKAQLIDINKKAILEGRDFVLKNIKK